ncbi:MAG: AAA family ATPase [Bdellovibrionales bacterium]|nr:AAA family ATPase [Bdellovibrionales bacterium]
MFGPRGCGKSTLLRELFLSNETVFVDLLDVKLMDELLIDSGRFERLIEAPDAIGKRVVIDEIQKFPKILDVVHQKIQKTKRQFVMTGSSSRKLKQAGTNLLAGRAWVYHLFPFSAVELGKEFDLKRALEVGTLPDSYLAQQKSDSKEFLSAYVATYLEREIQQEQWVKNIEPFRKFLAVAAQMNGKIVNRSKIARDIGVSDITISNYFEIVEETHLGIQLPAYHTSVRKAQKQAPKFFFIDTGIKRALDRTVSVELLPQTFAWGDAFEHWVILEIVKAASYARLDWQFSYLRTKDDLELDLVIDRPGLPPALIEIKSNPKVREEDAKTLELLGADIHKKADRYLFSMDPLEAKFGKTQAFHWQKGIQILFEN